MAPASWRIAFVSALILVSSAILAGCVGTASAASAKEWQSPADEAAQAWSADAQLVQIVGVEGTFPMQFAAQFFGAESSDADWSGAQEDESVGDGMAAVWLYRYVSDEKAAAYVVVVGKDGEVAHQEEDARQDDDVAVGDWTLDSDAALTAALAANDDLRTGVESEKYGIAAFLTRDSLDENPMWLIGGMGGDNLAGGGGFVILDAISGEVIESQGMSRMF